jgi:hypothetical protein
MKTKKILIVSVLAVALLGCGKREPRHIVILPDVSGSIDRESLEQAFKAIDDLAGHLHRGDRLTIIPILGDAEAEASGKILRFEVPANRQAYDTDLRDFHSKLNTSLKEMETNAVRHPGSKTDILGAIALAKQELTIRPQESRQALIILSDFIQEDEEVDFRTDHNFTNAITVQRFAEGRVARDDTRIQKVDVYLGLLKSHEFMALDKMRRDAVKKFWIEYLKNKSTSVQFVADGIGMLSSALSK